MSAASNCDALDVDGCLATAASGLITSDANMSGALTFSAVVSFAESIQKTATTS